MSSQPGCTTVPLPSPRPLFAFCFPHTRDSRQQSAQTHRPHALICPAAGAQRHFTSWQTKYSLNPTVPPHFHPPPRPWSWTHTDTNARREETRENENSAVLAKKIVSIKPIAGFNGELVESVLKLQVMQQQVGLLQKLHAFLLWLKDFSAQLNNFRLL